MKYELLIMIIILVGCTVYNKRQSVSNFNFPEKNKITYINDIAIWIDNNIEYQKDLYNLWKFPDETYNEKTGDCEDRAILMLAIAYDVFKIKGELIIQYCGSYKHAFPRINDIDYGKSENGEIIDRIKFDNLDEEIRKNRF